MKRYSLEIASQVQKQERPHEAVRDKSVIHQDFWIETFLSIVPKTALGQMTDTPNSNTEWKREKERMMGKDKGRESIENYQVLSFFIYFFFYLF